MNRQSFAYVLLAWLLFCAGYAQQVSINSSISVEDLVQNNLIQGCVEVSDISSPVNGAASGLNSFGYFERSNSNFPFENGIVLSTGNVDSAGNGEIPSILNDGNDSWGTDPDLETALGISGTLNATSIEFNFTSISNQIQFNYILASEEYFANFPCEYSDGFAFLIREANSGNPYTNIALVPGTSIPVNTTTVHDEIVGFCEASNEQYFEGYNLGDTNYNGRTTVLSATATIQPNVAYQIKLIIADQTDENYDSAVFIQGNSFDATVDLGEDFSTCAAEVTLDADINNPSASYNWYLDGSLISGATAPNLTAIVSGNYRVEIQIPLTGSTCIIEDDINIELSSTQTSDPISDFELCDDASNDGVEFFDLTTKDAEVLASVPPSSYTISYHLSQDDANNGSNAASGSTQNSINPQPIYVRIEDNSNGCLAFSNFNLIVNSLPSIVEPTPLVVCDDQNTDGATTIDLTVKDDEITNGQSDLVVNYHLTLSDAQAGINALPMPYVNTNPNEQLFVSIVNPLTGCRSTTTLDISVLDLPIINRDEHYIDACDTDHDGFAQFDLTSIIPEVLEGLTGVNVTFHESFDDAVNGINAIANDTNYANTVINEQVLFIRVEDNITGCAAVTPIEIHTNLLLTATNLNDILRCDADNDGTEDFDLQAIAAAIMNEIPDISIDFYETEEDRDNLVNPMDQTVPLVVTSNPYTLYLTLTSPTCFEVSSIEIILNPITEFDSIGATTVCDEDQDGLTQIDLSSFDDLVTQGQSGFTVTYFLSQSDAEANINALPNLYTNVNNPFTLFPRISSVDTGCADINSFDVEVLPAPESSTPNAIVICDADRDGIATIDLTASIPDIVTSTVDRSITFHNTFQDASLDQNSITNTTNYQAQTESVFVRVENTITGCYSVEELAIIVNTLPYVGNLNNELSPYNICENESDGIGDFLFETKDAEALNGQTGKTVSYFLSLSDAENRLNPIDKNATFQNVSNPQTIFCRVENLTDESCSAIASLSIAVGTNPEFNEPEDLFVCDDNSNDGTETINLTNVAAAVTNGINGIENVSFYLSEQDAINSTNPLPLNFTNTANPQEIFVQIDNGTICNSVTSFIVNIIQVPEANPAQPIITCDDDYDGLVTIDLTEAVLDILDVRQDDIEIAYYESIADAESNTNPIADPEQFSNSSNPQTVYIKITNTVSNCYSLVPLDIIVNLPPALNDFQVYEICDNADSSVDLAEITSAAIDDTTGVEISYHLSESEASSNTNPIGTDYTYTSTFDTLYIRASFIETGCFVTYAFNINVNPLPEAYEPNNLVACDDDFDGILEFDLSQQNTTILGDQSPTDYTLTFHNSLTTAESGTNSLNTNYFAYDGETIWARIENNTTGCFSLTEFNTIIPPRPVLDIGDQVICLDNLPLLVSANTNNPTDQYLWSTGATTPEIEIIEIGEYWVEVITEFGCESMEIFNVTESEAATIETTETVDFSDPNNITITVSGIGNYLYQLDGGLPQESNVFENVQLGAHTITIIDLNGCGEVTREVIVVDFPKHMTPNGDGQFDTWHLIGVETLPGTVIQIFNRYGKLLKVLTSETSGWDGTYQGSKMPSSDYWFVADIKRGNESFELKGHFALKR